MMVMIMIYSCRMTSRASNSLTSSLLGVAVPAASLLTDSQRMAGTSCKNDDGGHNTDNYDDNDYNNYDDGGDSDNDV